MPPSLVAFECHLRNFKRASLEAILLIVTGVPNRTLGSLNSLGGSREMREVVTGDNSYSVDGHVKPGKTPHPQGHKYGAEL